MTAQEIKRMVNEVKKITRNAIESKDERKKILEESGLYTKKGHLRKPYNGRF